MLNHGPCDATNAWGRGGGDTCKGSANLLDGQGRVWHGRGEGSVILRWVHIRGWGEEHLGEELRSLLRGSCKAIRAMQWGDRL